MSRSKRYLELKSLIDPKKIYSLEEAIELVKKTSTVTFDASVEVHLKLGIDSSKSDQQTRGLVRLPHGTGKTKRVAAFVGEAKETEAKAAGADLAGGEELIAQIAQSGKMDFDVAVATPEMMPKLAKIAKILGPRGLMPNPKTETVGADVKKMVEEMKGGKIAWKNDDTGNVHQLVGKVSMENAKLLENLKAFLDSVQRAKPASAKGIYIPSATLTSSMGPAVKIQI
ncbi:50S ribosomal protein L1 [Candidatus Uhrbacteria bacterium]|nr:50S ribosomal protein L1 [Candidatus Uhrbacteria bacterium]